MAVSRVADILIKAGLIDEWQARSALARQAQWGGRLARHVVEMGFASEEAVAEALARACNLQRVELGILPKDPAALSKVDAQTAEERGVFPYGLRDNGKTLWLAMADPCDIETADYIAARSNCRIRVTVAGEREILTAIYRHYKNQPPPTGLMGDPARPPPKDEIPAPPVSAAPRPAARMTTPMPVSRQPSSPPTTPLAMPRLGTALGLSSGADLPVEVQAALPPAAAEYLKRLQTDLGKTTRVLRALVEVCIEKNLLTAEDVRAAAARLVGR